MTTAFKFLFLVLLQTIEIKETCEIMIQYTLTISVCRWLFNGQPMETDCNLKKIGPTLFDNFFFSSKYDKND